MIEVNNMIKDSNDLSDMLDEFDKKFKKNQERIKNNELNNPDTNEVWGIPEPEKTPIANPYLGFVEPIDLGEDNEVSEDIEPLNDSPDIINTDNIEPDNIEPDTNPEVFDLDKIIEMSNELAKQRNTPEAIAKRQEQEQLEWDALYGEIEVIKANQVPTPEKIRAIRCLFDKDFQVTLSPNLKELRAINVSLWKQGKKEHSAKHPILPEWQNKRYNKNDLTEFHDECKLQFYDKFYGIITGVNDCNNVTVFDYDIKRLPEDIKTKILGYISEYIQTDYIQNMIRDKKMYVETTMSGGYHFIVLVNDEKERKSKKLLQFAKFEPILELIGKGYHCVTYCTGSPKSGIIG